MRYGQAAAEFRFLDAAAAQPAAAAAASSQQQPELGLGEQEPDLLCWLQLTPTSPPATVAMGCNLNTV